jgi:hypothetical protein
MLRLGHPNRFDGARVNRFSASALAIEGLPSCPRLMAVGVGCVKTKVVKKRILV